MTQKHSEYFDGVVVHKAKEVEEKRIYKNCDFLRLKKKFVKVLMIPHYFLFCKIPVMRSNFTFKIETTESIFNQANCESKVSIHLCFEYEYICFLFKEREPEPEIILELKSR